MDYSKHQNMNTRKDQPSMSKMVYYCKENICLIFHSQIYRNNLITNISNQNLKNGNISEVIEATFFNCIIGPNKSTRPVMDNGRHLWNIFVRHSLFSLY